MSIACKDYLTVASKCMILVDFLEHKSILIAFVDSVFISNGQIHIVIYIFD